MKGCSRYGGSTETNGIKNSSRIDTSGSSHRKFNIPNNGFLFFGRIFIGDRPGAYLICVTIDITIRVIIQFDHSSIDVIGKITTAVADSLDGFPHLFCTMADSILGNDSYTNRFQIVITLRMLMEFSSTYLLQVEDEHTKSTFLHYLGIQLAQGSCRTVSRIGKSLLSQHLLSLIGPFEILPGHIDFTTDLQIFRCIL